MGDLSKPKKSYLNLANLRHQRSIFLLLNRYEKSANNKAAIFKHRYTALFTYKIAT
jgi:hypothetical protein